MAGIEQYHETETGEVQRRADRQVDPARRHRVSHANGNDRQQDKIVQHQAPEIPAAEKARRLPGKEQDNRQEHQGQGEGQQRAHTPGLTRKHLTHEPSPRFNALEAATTSRISRPCTPLTQKLEIFSS